MNAKKEIQFVLSYHEKELIVRSLENECSDLRTLIMSKLDLDFFGECGGVGRCVTCLVAIKAGLTPMEEKIEEFACQIKVDEHLAGKVVTVIGDRLNPL